MLRNGLELRGVILAGGDGTRLQSLTTRIEGDSRPKQFCRLMGSESLLSQTRRRIAPLVDADKTITVVTKKHEIYYTRELNVGSPTSVLVQPENRGTGVAIGAAILMLGDLGPEAIIAAFPSDHHYSNEAGFLDVVKHGIAAALENIDDIVVVGAQAWYPETEYGWIEPAQHGTRQFPTRVQKFWEKPEEVTARKLLQRGCLWNTFVIVGRVGTFIDLLCDAAPNAMLRLSAAVMNGDLQSCYPSLPVIDFSRDVLTQRPERLLVIRDGVSGWTDLGNPDRVFATLAREKITPAWLESADGGASGGLARGSSARLAGR